VIYLDLEEVLFVAERVLPEVMIRDVGLLESALARPKATAFGEDAYPDLFTKAAALLQSITSNQPLVDGNKRLALAVVIAFLGMNGNRLDLTNDQAYELVMAVAGGRLKDVPEIAQRLVAG
jgi:death on curing protein